MDKFRFRTEDRSNFSNSSSI